MFTSVIQRFGQCKLDMYIINSIVAIFMYFVFYGPPYKFCIGICRFVLTLLSSFHYIRESLWEITYYANRLRLRKEQLSASYRSLIVCLLTVL
jgi:hypothetical protein